MLHVYYIWTQFYTVFVGPRRRWHHPWLKRFFAVVLVPLWNQFSSKNWFQSACWHFFNTINTIVWMLIVQMCRKINNINVQKQWGFSYEKLKIIKLYRKLKLYQHCEKHFLEIICFYHISNIFSWIYCIITLTSHLTNASKNTKRQLSAKYKIQNYKYSKYLFKKVTSSICFAAIKK